MRGSQHETLNVQDDHFENENHYGRLESDNSNMDQSYNMLKVDRSDHGEDGVVRKKIGNSGEGLVDQKKKKSSFRSFKYGSYSKPKVNQKKTISNLF